MNRRNVLRYSVWWLIAAAGLALTSAPTFGQAQEQSANAEPEANWGLPTQGFQISVAFTKPEFGAGEPVQAIIFTRNVSDRQLSYVANVPHYLQFLVVDEGSKRVPTRSELENKTPFQRRLEKIVNNPKHSPLAPGQERRDMVDLRMVFDLPPGKYSVSVTRTIPVIDDPLTRSEVVSGTATVAITAQSGVTAPGVQESPEPRTGSNRTGAVAIQPLQSGIQVSQGHEIEAPLQAEAESHSVSKADVAGVPALPAIVPWYEGKLVYAFGVLTLGAIIGFVVWDSRRKEPQR